MSEQRKVTIDELVNGAKAIFEDGLSFGDIPAVIKLGCEAAEAFGGSGPDKRQFAIDAITRVIEETDTPWLPDSLSDPLMIAFVPSAIDLFVGASKGLFKLQSGAPAEASPEAPKNAEG